MVRVVVRKGFWRGNLTKANLTLKDLEKVTQKFTHVLNAAFPYPHNFLG
jgi:membrane-associated HD superfamily phosphohydrolase